MIRKIFKAAIKYNNEIYIGKRHNNCFESIKEYNKIIDKNKINQSIQGFVDSNLDFVTREEAALIAYNAKQVNKKHKRLMSEHLY